MPPTFLVVALIVLQSDLPILPAAVGSVIAAGLGRLVLARYAGYSRRWLRGGRKRNLDHLGRLLSGRPRSVGLTSLVYSIALPTNVLFVAAGLSGATVRWILAGYWAARIPIDTTLVWGAKAASGDALIEAYRSPLGITLQVLAVVLIVATLRLPWARWVEYVATPAAEPADALS